MEKTNSKTNVLRLTLYAICIALILVLTCIPVQTLGFEISLAMIPISVGAVVLGPSGGAVLGSVYGVFSFMQCLGLLKPSEFGMALFAIHPLAMAITCIIPRFLCGWIAGLVFFGLHKIDKIKFTGHAAACLICPLLNTIFFMTAIMVFFGRSEPIVGYMDYFGTHNPFLFVLAFVGINGLIEVVACMILGTAISKAITAVKHF